MDPNEELHTLAIHFEPIAPKRGQPLYKGQTISPKMSLSWRFHWLTHINYKYSQF